MKRLNPIETGGQFVNGEWQVSNLRSLVAFMKKAGLTTGDIAQAMHLSRNAVTRWLKTDDCSLGRLMDVAEAFGCELSVSYELPQDQDDAEGRIIIDKLISRIAESHHNVGRLTFLSIALQQSGVTKSALADKLGITRASVQRWFHTDDMNMKYIYRIAGLYGWEVNIRYALSTPGCDSSK